MFFMLEDKEQSEEEKELERKEKAKQRRSRTNFRYVFAERDKKMMNDNIVNLF